MSRKPPTFPTSRDLMLKPGFQRPGTSDVPVNRTIPPLSHRQATSSPVSTTSSKPNLPKQYEPVSEFLFTEDKLACTPSQRDHGIDPQDEMKLRLMGACWIKELYLRINVRYKTPKVAPRISVRACCVAMIYFNRFFMYHSLGTFEPTHIATAALFLATKCEECPIRMKHFVAPLYNCTNPHDSDLLEPEDEAIIEELITTLETAIIRTLSFELKPNLCHYEVINADYLGYHLKKAGWQICSDIYQYTTLCLRYTEKTLAAVAIFCASGYTDVNLEDEYGPEWFKGLAPDLDISSIVSIAIEVTEAYERHRRLFPGMPKAQKDVLNAELQVADFQQAIKPPVPELLDEPCSAKPASQDRERHQSFRSEKDVKSVSDRHSHNRHNTVSDRQSKERHHHHRESKGSVQSRQHSDPPIHPTANIREKIEGLQQFGLTTRYQHRDDKEEGEL